MKEVSLEGSLVLEKLAACGLVEAFYEAIDADDFTRMRGLLRRAQVEEETIAQVLELAGHEGD